MEKSILKSLSLVQKELNDKWPNLQIISSYTGANNKVRLKCLTCGHEWETTVRSVIKSKRGCPHCGVAEAQKERTILYIKSIIGDNFEFISFKDFKHITFKCKECGAIRTTSTNNLIKYGCKNCKIKIYSDQLRSSTEEFIRKAKEIHGSKYDYSKVNYINYCTKVCIICPQHGEFWQTPNHHLRGEDCPKCCISHGEELVNKILTNLKISFTREHYIVNPYTENKKFRVDFYFNYNNSNYIIEYNGQQHYIPVKHWGGELQLLIQKERDFYLRRYCKENNIKLLEIKYTDKNIQNIIEQFLAVPSNLVTDLIITEQKR